MQPEAQPPINPLPPIVWLLFFAIVGVEITLSLGARGIIGGPEAIGWRLGAVRSYGFSGTVFDWMLSTGQAPFEHSIRLLTYPFVHQGFTSTLFAGVLLLALGKLVGEVMGQLAVFVVFFLSAIIGAICFGLLTDQGWLTGAFPAVYGLIGAYTFLMWHQLDAAGEGPARAFGLIGFLMGIQIVFALFTGDLRWVADLAGFLSGLVLSFVVVPGGWARLLRMTRQR